MIGNMYIVITLILDINVCIEIKIHFFIDFLHSLCFFCCLLSYQYECIFAKSCLTPAFTQKGFVTDSQEIEFPSEQGNKQKITPAVN